MKTPFNLRVMTFNTLKNGHCVKDGPQKIVKHIEAVNPDLVLLQELKTDEWNKTVEHIQPTWSIARDHGLGIISPHRILGEEHRKAYDDFAMGAAIEIVKETQSIIVHAWNLHTDHHHYGPYATFEDQSPESCAEVLRCEQGRMANLVELFADEVFRRNMKQARDGDSFMIVGGDFNSPSHLDWIASASGLHRNWSFTWPVSNTMTTYGFVDGFRAVHPDPVKTPGNTWSTIFQGHRSWSHDCPGGEPQDRIDHIYHLGNMFRPANGISYCGKEKLNLWNEGHYENDWPSDHFAVIMDYVLVCVAGN